MIEPISATIMVVQGISTIIKAVKSAAEETTDAFNKINECVESGRQLKDSMPFISKFFSGAGKYEAARTQLEEAKQIQDQAIANGEPVPDAISDAQYVMEMMTIDRQIKQYYDDIKHYFIYHFDEAGMWDDFWSRLSKLRADREAKAEEKRRADMERRLAIKAAEMAKRRAIAKQIEIIETVIAGFVVTALIIGFIFGLNWILKQGEY